jgi:hypothetical protein
MRKPGVIVLDLARCVGADQLILYLGAFRTTVGEASFFPRVSQRADQVSFRCRQQLLRGGHMGDGYSGLWRWRLALGR